MAIRPYKTFLNQPKAREKVNLSNLLNSCIKKSRQTARFTKGGFKVGQHKVPSNAKIGKLKIVWSRELPATPSSVTVIKDSAHRYFLSFVVEIQPELLPQTENSVGIDLGIKTFATVGTLHNKNAFHVAQRNVRTWYKD